jgi:PAS domain S-box-containing protein
MLIEECPVERLWKTHRRETDILFINDRWFSIAVDPLLEEAGRLIGAVHIMSDVTERKQVEEALRQSEEKYRTILETMQEAYYESDLTGHLTFVNDALCRHLGYTKEELIGKDFRQYQDEAHAKKAYQTFNEIYRTGEPLKARESEYIRKDGTKGIYEVSASLMRDGQGKPIGFRGVSRDITERKRAEQALQESEERFRALYDRSHDCVFVSDFEGKFIDANQAALTLLGYEKTDICSLNFASVLDERDISKGLEDFNEMIQTGFQKEISLYRLRRKDGGIVYVETQGSVIYRDGKPHSILGIARDVTERKRMEEALRESENKFRNLVENSIVGVYLVQDGLFKYVNPRGAEIHGYEIEEMVDKMGPKQMTLPEDWPTVEVSIGKRMRGEEDFFHYEFRVVTKSQEIRNVEVFGSRATYQGRPAVLGTMLDITDRKRTEEALRRSEERYRNILESIQDGYTETDLAGNFILVNSVTCKHLGYTKEELTGMNYRQYTSEENAKRIKRLYTEVYKTGKPINLTDHELISKDGTTATYELSVSLIRNAEGNPIGFRQTSRDITERKKSEEALRQSEERYRNILESIQDGYFEDDLAGNFTFVNDVISRHLGYTKEELIGMNYRKYASEETSKGLYQHFSELYRTGQPIKPFAVEYISRDRTKLISEISVSLIRDSEGKPIGFRGISRDVTERKEAEEALQRSEERYRTIIQNLQDGYFENDLAGNLTFVNDIICRNLRYTREELIGMNYRQYTDEEDRKKVLQQYGELYRTGQPIKLFEAKHVRKDGAKLFAEISVSLIRDSEGKPIGFRGISHDITERKQAEEEKLFLQEQLRQSQKMEAIGQLAGGVAHDFNNLLTVIKGYSQLSILDLKENDPLRSNIEEIEKATQRATDLTRQLLAFSRRQILDLKVLDLNVLLKDLEKMLRRIIGEDIELLTLLSKDLGKVKVDPSQIEQVIFNLAVNARDAMPSGGKLAIETANAELDEEYARAHVNVAPGRYVRLSVSDTGFGMTPEVKERVFEPFFTTKEKGKGTGLGLSMVYGIVRQSNGHIWLYSEPGRGATFRIYFPRTEEEADTLREREETDFFPRGSETILLVEDENLVRDLATRLLEQQGYRVLKAANGQEALLVAKEHVGETIHLLLADIVMPQMGGKELADWLKISRPNVKVLYTSGYADNAIVHHGVLDPGTHLLQKPFSLKTLSHKVREILDG